MSNESKRILAFFLCGLIFIGWMAMTSKQRRAPKVGQPQVTAPLNGATSAATTGTVVAAPSTPAVGTPPSLTKAAPQPQIKLQSADLANDSIQVRFTNAGGRIEGVSLKQFKQSLKNNTDPVQLVFDADLHHGSVRWDLSANGQPLADSRLAEVISAPGALTFVYPQQGGVELRKTYRLPTQGYVLQVELEAINRGSEPMLLSAAASVAAEAGSVRLGRFNGNPKDQMELVAYVNEHRVHHDLAKLKANENYPGNAVAWGGIMDRYFLAALLPSKAPAEAVVFEHALGDQLLVVDAQGQVLQQSTLATYSGRQQLDAVDKLADYENAAAVEFHSALTGEKKLQLPLQIGGVRQVELRGKTLRLQPQAMQSLEAAGVSVASGAVKLLFPARSITGGNKTAFDLDLYVGPKDFEILSQLNRHLDKSIDLGDWIGVIARPMLQFMKWSYGWLKNYGWAIILLTVLVRLLLYPLTHMQFRSMQKMQLIKPQMEALRTKYKDNKEELNRQMLELFRREKVNPMGGCFPILLQMPVFFALYRVLYNAIELRHAPFALWLQDLSANDPYYVTPILLGLVMFVQQKMTPTAGMDPSQEMMMKFMPIMFCFFMLYLPSGLVLYILVSTLLGLAQQWWVTRSAAPIAAATAAVK